MNLDKESYNEMKNLELSILEQLKLANDTKDTSSKESKDLLESHKRWLRYTWTTYSKEAHIGLAFMYVSDERFYAYYENVVEDGSQFLHDVIIDNLS